MVMRALPRRTLVLIALAAAVFTAGVPAQFAAAATTHPTGKYHFQDCPAGTNWDNVTHSCV
jgi:hypothetical protein